MKWYRLVTENNDKLPDALEYFENQYEIAKGEIDVKGKRIEEVSRRLPGMVEYRFAQLQEIEAILAYFQLKVEKATMEAKKDLLENYPRALSDRTAEKYAEVDPDVYDLKLIMIEVSRIRNLFLSITKGVDHLHWQISNIVKLRQAGIEDSVF